MISQALGSLMKFIYYNLAFESYGLSIIVFTILTKIALLPLAIKSFNSLQKNQEIGPEIQEIQRLYKDDKMRMNEEIQKVYKKHGVSPFAGCLPLLIQIPIMFALYEVIRKPLTFIMGIGAENIKNIANTLNIPQSGGIEEIKILTTLSNDSGLLSKVSDFISSENIINLNFLNIFNLGLNPSYSTSALFGDPKTYVPILFIPILAAVTTYLQTKIQIQKPKNNKSNNNNEMAGMESMTKSMGLFMPIMILLISFSVPAGLGLYWIVSNVIQIIQQLLFNKLLVKKKEGV